MTRPMKRNPSLLMLMAGFIVFLLFSGGDDCLAAKMPLKRIKRAVTVGSPLKPVEKPDPFRPFIDKEMELKARAAKKAAVVSIFPLQKAGIEQFKLVGIISDDRRRLAIVETRDGKGRCYPLALGTVIGLNKGRVVQIQDDLIVVEEAIPGRNGQVVNRIVKKLHINEEEGAS